jgi:hypothetical protein
MDDFKSVTLSDLRDLARKHLGPGYSKLTKRELIAALAEFVPAVKKLAQGAGLSVPSRAKPPAKRAEAAAKATREPERKPESEKKGPEKKRQPEWKKEPEGKKVPEKKNPEGKKGPEKKAPEPKKAAEKRAPEPKKAPEAKRAPEPKKAPEAKRAPEPKKAPEAQKARDSKKAPEQKSPAQKREPEAKKALEPKREPEAKKSAEPKKAPEAKKAPEPKKEPEAKPAPELKKQPEAKPAPEPKREPEQKKAPEKKEPEPKKEPEKKAAPSQDRKPASGRSAAAKAEELAQSRRLAHVVNFPPRSRSSRYADGSWNEDTADMPSGRSEAAAPRPAEPLLEGFFVARVVGERELRRHHLAEDQAPRTVTSNATGYEENLGELPVDYASDVAMALARDPHTLFVSWDFSLNTRARAMEGLDEPRPILRIYEGDKLVRVEEFVLESRSFYIHGLPPGRSYRVEAHFVGRDGRSRRIGPSTHPVMLPQSGLSQNTGVRFMRMPPPPPPAVSVAPQPVVIPSEPARQLPVEEREFITWQRVPLPGSADMATVLESRRERIQRQVPPGAPAVVPPHLEVSARPLGASELLTARGQQLGGASELAAARGRAPGGASEQVYWTPPPSGRGR